MIEIMMMEIMMMDGWICDTTSAYIYWNKALFSSHCKRDRSVEYRTISTKCAFAYIMLRRTLPVLNPLL
jgi:hypothetical protein